MALAAVLETLEGTPESLHQFYKKIDDKFVLDADVESHPQVQGLRNAYKADHEKVKVLSSEVKKFENVDPDRWATLKDLSDEDILALEQIKVSKRLGTQTSAATNPDLETEIAKRINPMKTAHQRELEQREALLRAERAEKEKMAADMRKNRIETALANACVSAGVVPGAIEEVVLFGSQFFKINEETGDITAVDRSGTEIFGADGKPMRPTEWVTTRGVDKVHWFPLNSGGGAGGGRHGDNHITKKSDLKDLQSKVAYVRKHGQDKYLSLPD